MTFKRITVSSEAPEIPSHIEWDMHFNHMPKPWVEITEDEYLHRVSGERCLCSWYQQVRDIGPTMVSIDFALLRDGIYGKSHPSGWRSATKEEIAAGSYNIVYTERPRYFRVGCIHEYTYKPIGQFLTLWTCKHCGFERTVDSSD